MAILNNEIPALIASTEQAITDAQTVVTQLQAALQALQAAQAAVAAAPAASGSTGTQT